MLSVAIVHVHTAMSQTRAQPYLPMCFTMHKTSLCVCVYGAVIRVGISLRVKGLALA